MSSCLKIGDRLFNGDQLISALVQYKLLEPLVGQVLMDDVLKTVALAKQDVFYALGGTADTPLPDNFDHFLTDWCQQHNLTLTYFKEVILRELQLKKFKQLQFGDRVESEFLRIKSDIDQVEYSLIQLTDSCLAQELYFQLRDDGADFPQLAQQYSSGTERHTGGWVGPVPMSTLPIEVATLFRQGTIGTVFAPVPVADSVWITRLERFTAARLSEATRASLMEQLYTRWLQSQIKTLIATPGSVAVQSGELQSSSNQD